MLGAFNRQFSEPFDPRVADPWVVLAYFERVFDRLPHSLQAVRAHAVLHTRGTYTESSLERVRAKMRPADEADLDRIFLSWVVLDRPDGVYNFRIDIVPASSTPTIDFDLRADREDMVLSWMAILRDEVPNAIATAKRGLPLPARLLPDEPEKPKLRHRMRPWLGDVSSEVVGGLIVAGVLALVAFVWAVFFK